MPANKVIAYTLLFALVLVLLASCSSSRKVRKKCRECPEFSQVKPNVNTVPAVYEEL